MKRLFQAGAVTLVFVVLASAACAATTVKSSKSNSSDRVAVHDSVLTETEATAFLALWNKTPAAATTDAAVRGMLQQVLGAKAGNVKKIVVEANRRPPRVILLADPTAEAQARALPDPGAATTGAAPRARPAPGGTGFPAPPAQPAGMAVSDPGAPTIKPTK